MNREFNIGDWVKIADEGRAFKIYGFTKDLKHVPDGFLIEHDGTYVNPKFCDLYKGATSVLS